MKTTLDQTRLPPLYPRTVGGKIAISCHKPGEFLIRAWTSMWRSPDHLVNWICHYIGRMNMADLEWWGYTYPGQPSYMRSSWNDDSLLSGLMIQRYVEPPDKWTRQAIEHGRVGSAYSAPEPLEIPERGLVVAAQAAS